MRFPPTSPPAAFSFLPADHAELMEAAMAVVRRHGNNGDAEDAYRHALDNRRDPLSLTLGVGIAEAGLLGESLPPRAHLGKCALVTSQLQIGIDQKIVLSWDVPREYENSGYRMLGFRRSDGFPPHAKSWDLSAHGQRIIDSRTSDIKAEHLAEGEYFYTFILYRTGLLLNRGADVIQFSEVIPSAEHVIRRLKHHIEARKLVEELIAMASSAELRRRKAKADAEPREKAKALKEKLEAEFARTYDAEMALNEHLAGKRAEAKSQYASDPERLKDFDDLLERFKEKMIEKYGLG